MNILLFGFKGSGKTHFGKLLASKMHRPFIDTDHLMLELYQKDTGKKGNCSEIYRELGEAKFRALEKRALYLLKNVQNTVIALGGGAVLDPENVAFLQNVGSLIFLKASPDTVKARIFKGEMPALFDSKDPEKALFEMFQKREPIYRSIPARLIDTDTLDEAGVLAALCSILLLEGRD